MSLRKLILILAVFDVSVLVLAHRHLNLLSFEQNTLLLLFITTIIVFLDLPKRFYIRHLYLLTLLSFAVLIPIVYLDTPNYMDRISLDYQYILIFFWGFIIFLPAKFHYGIFHLFKYDHFRIALIMILFELGFSLYFIEVLGYSEDEEKAFRSQYAWHWLWLLIFVTNYYAIKHRRYIIQKTEIPTI
ncbi:hypothetical protein [Basilea psittacipulmonis]|uniref:Uncharacterized protein n=1 Tax=Basilea psittacipulmonis DSM 24701 TaxID=1072685 RepID=A0A077DE68_9BURK|nr:hypothetical protein [Basilea psittacipulmonis]AIL32979.1 hypothetical protein IX83_06320 [Basilea psittacipulmonis DSM 24701]